MLKKRKEECMRLYKTNMSNFLVSVNKKRLKLFEKKLCKKKRAVIGNSKKRKSENVKKQRKPSNKK